VRVDLVKIDVPDLRCAADKIDAGGPYIVGLQGSVTVNGGTTDRSGHPRFCRNGATNSPSSSAAGTTVQTSLWVDRTFLNLSLSDRPPSSHAG
jgi:hypothetical protein